MRRRGGLRFAAPLAAAWCLLFAALHIFWALGGGVGLASSAGKSLAARRPATFVIFGLWGVAAVLLLGAAYILAVAPRRHWTAVLLGLAGAGLLICGVGLEVLLAGDIGRVRSSVGPAETHASLLLWNPWFVLGGTVCCAAAVSAYRAASAER